TEVV
ncbi:hypothetical protein MK534_00700, partial [Streptococcus gallolyticus subsp. gallolyticus]